MVLLCGYRTGKGWEDKSHHSPALPSKGEGIREWAPWERAEIGKASLAFKCFLKALGSIFPVLLRGSQEKGVAGRGRKKFIAC